MPSGAGANLECSPRINRHRPIRQTRRGDGDNGAGLNHSGVTRSRRAVWIPGRGGGPIAGVGAYEGGGTGLRDEC